ncbi:uncharacterized protein LOC143021336 [Oratosquilla oratoria]|uniref:uncharacterized protein LOC143021336 n=1 Tax=Oratosquilla oratoria TaxID=337810 RepID=UPI003F772D07
MPPRWTEELTYKFVMLYKEHECLWNMHSEMYRNKLARQSALSDICVQMDVENFGINDAKQKIKILRTTFQQEQSKVEKSERSGAGFEDVYRYKPSVIWFQAMSDIMKQGVLKRTSQSSLDTVAEGPVEDDRLSECDVKDDYSTQHYQHSPQSENVEGKSTKIVSVQKTTTRKRISEISSAIEELKELNRSINNPKQVNAECESFAKYVAVHLEKLSPENCILAQDEIHRILTKYRLAEITSCPCQ